MSPSGHYRGHYPGYHSFTQVTAIPLKMESSDGYVFYLWVSKLSANEETRYTSNVFPHWLRPCSVTDRKASHIFKWKWATMSCMEHFVYDVYSMYYCLKLCIFVFAVSHNETLHVQCGLTYTPPGSFTTPLPTTPEPTTTQPTTTTTPTTTTPTTTSPTTTTTATTTTTMSTTTTTPAITTEPTTMSQSTTTTSTTSSSTTTSSPSSSSVSVPSSESTTVSTTPPANGTFGGRDRDSDDSNTVFGFSKGETNGNVAWTSRHLQKITDNSIVCSTACSSINKQSINTPHCWPQWCESTGDQ